EPLPEGAAGCLLRRPMLSKRDRLAVSANAECVSGFSACTRRAFALHKKQERPRHIQYVVRRTGAQHRANMGYQKAERHLQGWQAAEVEHTRCRVSWRSDG